MSIQPAWCQRHWHRGLGGLCALLCCCALPSVAAVACSGRHDQVCCPCSNALGCAAACRGLCKGVARLAGWPFCATLYAGYSQSSRYRECCASPVHPAGYAMHAMLPAAALMVLVPGCAYVGSGSLPRAALHLLHGGAALQRCAACAGLCSGHVDHVPPPLAHRWPVGWPGWARQAGPGRHGASCLPRPQPQPPQVPPRSLMSVSISPTCCYSDP